MLSMGSGPHPPLRDRSGVQEGWGDWVSWLIVLQSPDGVRVRCPWATQLGDEQRSAIREHRSDFEEGQQPLRRSVARPS